MFLIEIAAILEPYETEKSTVDGCQIISQSSCNLESITADALSDTKGNIIEKMVLSSVSNKFDRIMLQHFFTCLKSLL